MRILILQFVSPGRRGPLPRFDHELGVAAALLKAEGFEVSLAALQGYSRDRLHQAVVEHRPVRVVVQLEPTSLAAARHSIADLAERELDMAKRLVEDMTEKWKPEQYKDTFQDQIMDLVEKKAREGKLEAVGGPEEAVDRRSADVIDLTELLKRSLAAKPGKARAAEADEEDDAPEKAPAKSKPASKAKTSKSSSSSRTRKAPAASSKSSKKAS